MYTIRVFLPSISLLLLSVTGLQAQPKVSAYFNVSSFSVNRAAVLSIIVDGTSTATVILPDIKHVNIRPGGQQKEVNVINGSEVTSVKSLFLVQPMQPGDYTLPPLTVKTDESILTTNPITFQVSSANTTSLSSQLMTGETKSTPNFTFVELKYVKERSYPGEIFHIEIKAYFPQRVKTKIESLPTLQGNGFVMAPVEPFPPQSREIIDGKPYIAMIWETTLSGVKEGVYNLSVSLDATLMFSEKPILPSSYREHGFFQDAYFNEFFKRSSSKTLTVLSEKISASVLPFPDKDKPDSFTGAIGNFELDVNVTNSSFRVGDPLKVTYTVKGTGNFDRVEPPAFPENKHWKTYAPSSEFLTDEYSFDGEKVFSQTIVAINHTVKEIPAISFSYYHPETNQYITKRSDPIPVFVSMPTEERNSQSFHSQIINTNHNVIKEWSGDLVPLRPLLGTLQPFIQPLQKKVWFLSSVALLATSMLFSVIYQLFVGRFKNDPEHIQAHLLGTTLQESLIKIEEAKKHGDSGNFLAACRTAIQHQYGLVWKIDPLTITLGDIKERSPDSSKLLYIFEIADGSVFSGRCFEIEEMEKYANILKEELGKLS